jgi:hypothetical protein
MDHEMGQVTCVWSMDHEQGQETCLVNGPWKGSGDMCLVNEPWNGSGDMCLVNGSWNGSSNMLVGSVCTLSWCKLLKKWTDNKKLNIVKAVCIAQEKNATSTSWLHCSRDDIYIYIHTHIYVRHRSTSTLINVQSSNSCPISISQTVPQIYILFSDSQIGLPCSQIYGRFSLSQINVQWRHW